MNCVVICCDTFRADLLDDPAIHLPNLRRLARQGVSFTHAFGEGLPTIQARRTLFTGVRSFPWRFGMDGRGLTPAIAGWHRIPDEQTTLAEHLLERGIVTGLVADTYHMFKPTQNFTRGFASWSFIRGQEGDPVRSGPLSAIDLSPYEPDGKNDPYRNPILAQYLLNMLDRKRERDYLPAQVFRRAAEWLAENRENAPWFLWVDSFAPHERWDPPMAFADRYCPPGQSKNYIQPYVINRLNPSAAEIARTKALYYGYATFVDKWIGHFLRALRRAGRLDDTMVIFTSDHGTELWDHGRFGKGGDRMHAYNTRVPLVLRPPGGQRAARRDDFAQHQDLFPTIAAALGAPLTPGVAPDGRNLLDPAAKAPERIAIAWGSNVSVRDRAWNLVFDSTGVKPGGQLFDLAADPGETTNVYDAHPAVVAERRAWLEATLGPLPYPIRHTGDARQAPPLVARFRKPATPNV